MTTRLSRSQQVEQNRALVLAAARRVLLARGYAGSTIDAIAEDAGFSKGVVYSQFGGKADLFLALLEQRIAERAEVNRRIVADSGGPDALRRLARRNAQQSEDEPDWPRLLLEFRLVAARDPDLNERYAALHARTVDQFAAAISAALARDGIVPVQPARTIAQLVLALESGVVLERAADPAALPAGLAEFVLTRLISSD